LRRRLLRRRLLRRRLLRRRLLLLLLWLFHWRRLVNVRTRLAGKHRGRRAHSQNQSNIR
jgi:hypothetical protein